MEVNSSRCLSIDPSTHHPPTRRAFSLTVSNKRLCLQTEQSGGSADCRRSIRCRTLRRSVRRRHWSGRLSTKLSLSCSEGILLSGPKPHDTFRHLIPPKYHFNHFHLVYGKDQTWTKRQTPLCCFCSISTTDSTSSPSIWTHSKIPWIENIMVYISCKSGHHSV